MYLFFRVPELKSHFYIDTLFVFQNMLLRNVMSILLIYVVWHCFKRQTLVLQAKPVCHIVALSCVLNFCLMFFFYILLIKPFVLKVKIESKANKFYHEIRSHNPIFLNQKYRETRSKLNLYFRSLNYNNQTTLKNFPTGFFRHVLVS